MEKFLDQHIMKMRKTNAVSINLTIITGRGKGSHDGISVIKENVIKRLQVRKLENCFINEGRISVNVFQNSLLGHQAS